MRKPFSEAEDINKYFHSTPVGPPEPSPLPAPLIDPDSSVSDAFDVSLPSPVVSELSTTDSNDFTLVSGPSAKPVPGRGVAPTSLVQHLQQLTTVSPRPVGGGMAVAPAVTPGVFGGPIDVPNPATLRALLMQPGQSFLDDRDSMSGPPLRVRLSGTALQRFGTQWDLMPGSALSDFLPPASDRLETIALPPRLAALFDHGQRRWYVVAQTLLQRQQAGPRAGQDAETPAAPVGSSLASGPEQGLRKLVFGVLRAAEDILAYHRYNC